MGIPSPAALTSRQLAAQTVITGFVGTAPGHVTLAENLRDGVGGFLLFGSNIDGAEQVRALNAALSCGAGPIAPWISVDQEPGAIARLDGILPEQPTPARLGADVRSGAMTASDVQELGRLQGSGLRDLGFNMDLAPVVDVARQGAHDVIGDRSFGDDPTTVSTLGGAYLDGLQGAGVAAVVKHFPGLGAVGADPHTSVPTITISRDEWSRVDAGPFATAIARGVVGIMVTDVVMDALDPGVNARQSPIVVDQVLRTELGYKGLVITDAIEMGLPSPNQAPQAAVRSIAAGVDVVLVSDGAIAQQIIDALTEAIDTGTLPRSRIETAVARNLAAKQQVLGTTSSPMCKAG